MVVFGAGASYGSRPGDAERLTVPAPVGELSVRRPPLTVGLFSERLGHYAAKYRASRPAIVILRAALDRDPDTLIEAAIGRLYEEAADDPERARQLLALRFYLWELINNETNEWWDRVQGFTHYADLLVRLGAWRHKVGEEVVLVTLNYDELLDRSAIQQVGNWELTTFRSYIARSDWRLYKLHGSIGWSRVLKMNIEGVFKESFGRKFVDTNDLIAMADTFNVGNGELRPEPWTRAIKVNEIAIAAPGIAVPTDRKNTFECPPEHLARFVSEIKQVDRLLTIGWPLSAKLV